ncbi:MAG: glycosyltransferase family 2 protein, partial [Roseiflexus sp.]|nr:glycosyltransferase family 2 protein [Roseiflexus sp.]
MEVLERDRPTVPDKLLHIPSVAVVIPAYRAEKHILRVLSGIPAFVSFIIVVNDCSPDETANIVRGYADPRVHLISHEVNQGVGGAVLTGYNKAVELGAEIIVKMDSDDQMDP